jgi:hypothetical protein
MFGYAVAFAVRLFGGVWKSALVAVWVFLFTAAWYHGIDRWSATAFAGMAMAIALLLVSIADLYVAFHYARRRMPYIPLPWMWPLPKGPIRRWGAAIIPPVGIALGLYLGHNL